LTIFGGGGGGGGSEFAAPVSALPGVVHGYRTSSKTYGGGGGGGGGGDGSAGAEDGEDAEVQNFGGGNAKYKKKPRKKTMTESAVKRRVEAFRRGLGRGSHSFPFQLNLSSSVHWTIRLNS